MKKQLLFLLFSIISVTLFGRTVTGTVTQKSDGEPVIGASVMVKGTSSGVMTDIDGKYSIEVSNNKAVLVFTYIGYNTETVKVDGRSVIDVVMTENATVLDEVVVTAMGQVQEKKKLNYAVQSLNSDELTAGVTPNMVNSLQGKIAGVNVSMSGGSPNSASQLVIRGISSVNSTQSNEALVVIDGMAVSGGATAMGDLNPNDIATISVLKGAAASSLYGSEGANGVILITTKSGKAGEVKVTASGGWEISNVLNTPGIQSTYGPGSNGIYVTNANNGWGPVVADGVKKYNNVDNFLGTGFMQKYDVAVSGGSEKVNAYASANFMDNEGVVHDDYRKQLGIYLKGEFKPSNTVKMQLSSNFINRSSRGFGNAMSSIYNWAITRDMSDYRTLEGYPNWSNRYDNWEELTDAQRVGAGTSPLYGRYMDSSKTDNTRMLINGSVQWEPIKNLTFTAKASYDKSFSNYESMERPRYKGDEFISDVTSPSNPLYSSYAARQGSVSFQPSRSEKLVAQGLVSYLWKMTDDINLNAFAGFEWIDTRGVETSINGQQFVLGGDFFSFNNTSDEWLSHKNVSIYHTKKNKYGWFGEIRFDYKGMAQLSVTGRLDGSSAFKQSDKTSYFYPSVTGGLIFSEIFKLSNEWFSFGKIRGNWAKVGKDCASYVYTPTYKQWSTFPDGGFSIDPTTSVAAHDLEPEMNTTWEIGADLRFFNNHTRLDVAYYSTKVDNQIVTVRVSPASGTILQTRNEGELENHGVEVSLSQDIITNRDFNWTANVNFSYNRGRLNSLPEDMTEIQGTQYGDMFPCAYLHGPTTAISGTDYLRAPDGQVIVDEQGRPKINPAKGNLIGNREPDFLVGLGSTFIWKDLSLSFLFDCRKGGDVANITGRNILSNGMSSRLDTYRNREVVFQGVVEQPDGTFIPNTNKVILDQQFINNYVYNVASNFIEDGSYIRLSHVTVGYDFSRLMKRLGGNNPIKGLKCSLTGRNLFLWTKYTGSDPQIMPTAARGSGQMGIDNFSVPSLRTFNFSVNVSF